MTTVGTGYTSANSSQWRGWDERNTVVDHADAILRLGKFYRGVRL